MTESDISGDMLKRSGIGTVCDLDWEIKVCKKALEELEEWFLPKSISSSVLALLALFEAILHHQN